MLFWPLLYGLIYLLFLMDFKTLVTESSQKNIKTILIKRFFAKAILNWIIFVYFIYQPFNNWFSDFDTSGHIICTLFSYASWCDLMMFNEDHEKELH